GSPRWSVESLSPSAPHPRLPREVTPRRPFKAGPRPAAADGATPENIEELSRRIAQIEQDGRAVPVRLRQYLELGGGVLGFSLDRDFADTLDGLIMVDLREVEEAVLARYMGKRGAATFRMYHGLASRVPDDQYVARGRRP